MGNKMMCLPIKDLKGGFASRSKKEARRSSSQRKLVSEKEADHLSHRFENIIFNRIASTRHRPPRRSLSDPVLSKQVPMLLERVETKKVVLVHGEGFGAWCWYKIIPLLEDAGMHPIALDLAGSRSNYLTDINSISCLEDYAKSLLDYLSSLADDEKVILVGHSGGGAIISFAMERYPGKISKSIFISATMATDGQRPFDPFAEYGSAEHFLKESQNLVYGNGRAKPPTSLVLEKDQFKALYLNRCSPKDVALASLSMSAVPLAPMMEKLTITPENYGRVKRFFVQTLEDNILSLQIQEEIVCRNPPNRVYKIKGSDHSPFLSKPRSLNKILLEIAQL